MILTNLLWKLHCQILQLSHSICVQMPLLKSVWERQSQQKRRWKCISFLRGYSHEKNLNLSGVERWETPAALQHCYRWLSHCELWPQAFIGLFPSFKYFKKVKPPGLLRPECLHHGLLQPFPDTAGTLQHPSVQSLGLFAFAKRTSASFSLLMLTGLPVISSFWGMLPRCQGPGIANYQLLMGTWQSHFHEHPKIQDKLCWRKD